MLFKKTLFLFVLIAVLHACSAIKKTRDSSAPLVVNLDTLKTNDKEVILPVYRASVTRKNDILHTKLEVSFDWLKQYMYGKATIRVKPYFYPTGALSLDARGMELREVSLVTAAAKTPLSYEYAGDMIHIRLDKEYTKEEEYTIFIDYIAKPNELKKTGGSMAITDDKGLYFINPDGKDKNKPQQIWTQGETQSSSVWFPTIDHPNERMTQEIYITTENKYVTLSNGELVSSFDNGNGTHTDYWKMDLPHAPYLTMMAIGDFAIIKDSWRGKEVNYFVEKEYGPYAKAIFGHTPEMMDFFSEKLGVPYPWNKYDQVVVRDYVSGAMENTTATLHGEMLQKTTRELLDENYEDVVSHELFHQWFGDLVTCESWSNTPLNESFATYGEYLWREHKYGLDAADYHSAESREGYLSRAGRKKETLIRFYYDDKEDMFDEHSYNKGGQVLHMLRKYVGDAAFFASLKSYLESNKFDAVEVHNLRLAFEKTTGEDLNWFFNQWFLSPGHPELIIKTPYDSIHKKQRIEITQTQDFSKSIVYRIPMYVDVYSDGKADRKRLDITERNFILEFPMEQKPDLINVDAEKMLLCRKTETKSIAEWIYQYKHAPLYSDRYEALVGLCTMSNQQAVVPVLIEALNDKFWGIRKKAISLLKTRIDGKEEEVKNKLITLLSTDQTAKVRKSVIDFLSVNYTDKQLIPLYKKYLQDSSYAVAGAALMAIAKNNPKDGVASATQFENEKNMDILSAVMSIYSEYGSDENNDFFLKITDRFKGYYKIGFIIQYGDFLRGERKIGIINSGVSFLASMAMEPASPKWVNQYVKKVIKDIENSLEEKITKHAQQLKASGTINEEDKILQEEMDGYKKEKDNVTTIYKSLK